MTRSIASRLLKVEPHEAAALAWSCAYFFCLLSGYYILRPIRDSAAAAGGVENVKWLYLATFGASLAASVAFGAVVTRFARGRFLPIVYRFFLVNLLVFFVLFKAVPDAAQVNLGRVFYVWVSVYNLFIVSVFWSFMADVFTNEQGKRLFAFIAVGGTLGQIAGSLFVKYYAGALGAENLVLVTVVLLEASCWCVFRLNAIAAAAGAGRGRPDDTARAVGGHALSGAADVARSSYLIGICSFMLFYTVTSTFLEIAKLALGAAQSGGRDDQVAFFAGIDMWTGVATILAQVFLTGRLMSRVGVGITIGVLPIVTLLGFVAFGAALARPDLLAVAPVLTLFIAVRRAANYAVSRPAREVLYTVVNRDERFKAKNLIDTVVYRLGDQLGAWVDSWLRLLGGTFTAVAALPVAAAWFVLGLELGRVQRARARSAA